eukprot:scaffold66_cov233-Pinguiococcus_pyrenoidosus.AAC.12
MEATAFERLEKDADLSDADVELEILEHADDHLFETDLDADVDMQELRRRSVSPAERSEKSVMDAALPTPQETPSLLAASVEHSATKLPLSEEQVRQEEQESHEAESATVEEPDTTLETTEEDRADETDSPSKIDAENAEAKSIFSVDNATDSSTIGSFEEQTDKFAETAASPLSLTDAKPVVGDGRLNQLLVEKGLAPLASEVARIPQVADTVMSLVLLLNQRDVQLQSLHSENRVRERERKITALEKKVAEAIHKEKTLREREGTVMRHLSASKARNLSRTKVGEIVQAYEATRARAEQDIDSLQAEVASLNSLLKEKENTILNMSLSQSSVAGHSTSVNDVSWDEQQMPFEESTFSGLEREETQRWRERALQAARQARTAKAREKSCEQTVESLRAEVHQFKVKVACLEDERENLRLEVQGRPAARAFKDAKARIAELERRLHAALSDLDFQKEERSLRKFMPTSELIRRDKDNHRLGLQAMHSLPTDVCRDVLQAACRVLDLSDVSQLCPSIEKLCEATRGLPRLERFVRTVCSSVFSVELERDPNPRGSRRPMEDVFNVLRTWRQIVLSVDGRSLSQQRPDLRVKA